MAWGTVRSPSWPQNAPRILAEAELDWFAANGVNGLVDPIGAGVVAGSDTSHLALSDTSRKSTRAADRSRRGRWHRPATGRIAFRGNFASVDEDLRITDRRAGRIREGRGTRKALDGSVSGGSGDRPGGDRASSGVVLRDALSRRSRHGPA